VGTSEPTVGHYIAVARRRKWIIVQAAILVPLAVVLVSLQQKPVYEGTADVLLSRQNLATSLSGVQDNSAYDSERSAQTQADLASSRDVARRALIAAKANLTTTDFLNSSTVTAKTNADVLSFAVRNGDRALASRLTNAYASAYTGYRKDVETAPIKDALARVRARINRLHPRRGQLFNELVDKEQQLTTMEALLGKNATVLDRSTTAQQVAPRPLRNGVLGLMLGLVLGIALAFLREALDTRVRGADEIAERVDLPLLARLPEPPRKLRTTYGLAMLAEPSGAHAEAFRILRSNFEFTSLGKDVRTIMITSSVEEEGKSTTIANLAVALARSGRHVILADFDLRRPSIDRFFGLRGRPGLSDVAVGHVELEHALVPIPFSKRTATADLAPDLNGHASGNGHAERGRLEVLPSGPIPPAPGEFIGTDRVKEIIAQLRERADLVLLDAPPLLHVGDALVLSTEVEGVLVVARMDVVHRGMITELDRLLRTMPSAKLGLIIAGADADSSYGYGYASYYGRPPEPARRPRRLLQTRGKSDKNPIA
jgi:Mrp family chromosome partitioning ATPase/capsular polysaccharide biosynthesis protein